MIPLLKRLRLGTPQPPRVVLDAPVGHTRRDVFLFALAVITPFLSSRARLPRIGVGAAAGRFTALRSAYLQGGGCPSRAAACLAGIVEAGTHANAHSSAALHERRAIDFTSGRTLLVDGWILGESEALCAVALAGHAQLRV